MREESEDEVAGCSLIRTQVNVKLHHTAPAKGVRLDNPHICDAYGSFLYSFMFADTNRQLRKLSSTTDAISSHTN